jgi:hypothetical protein
MVSLFPLRPPKWDPLGPCVLLDPFPTHLIVGDGRIWPAPPPRHGPLLPCRVGYQPSLSWASQLRPKAHSSLYQFSIDLFESIHLNPELLKFI